MTRLHRFATYAYVLAAVACSESTAPTSSIDGDYELVSVGGKPMPGLMKQEFGYRYYVTSVQVRLSTVGSLPPWYEAVVRDSLVSLTGDPPIILTETFGEPMQLSAGDSITLSQFFDTVRGRLSGGTLTLPRSAGDLVLSRLGK